MFGAVIGVVGIVVVGAGVSTTGSFFSLVSTVDFDAGSGSGEVSGVMWVTSIEVLALSGLCISSSDDALGSGVMGRWEMSWLLRASPMTPSTFRRLAARDCEGMLTPPAVGRPSSARLVIHALYLTRGNRSLTSSIVINFFSLLRRCVRGIAVISMGSPFSSC